MFDDKKFSSVQQYYQFQKVSAAGNRDFAAKILCSCDSVEQYHIGNGITPGSDKWDEAIAEDNMEKAVRAKFVQNPILLKVPLDTKNRTIIECRPNPHDLLWASGFSILTDSGLIIIIGVFFCLKVWYRKGTTMFLPLIDPFLQTNLIAPFNSAL